MPKKRGLLGQFERSLVADPEATYGALLPLAKGGQADWQPEPKGPGKPPWRTRPEPGTPRLALPSFARESALGGAQLLRGAAGELPAGQELPPLATQAAMDITGGGWAARSARPASRAGVELGMGGGRRAAGAMPERRELSTATMEKLAQGGLRRNISPQAVRDMMKRGAPKAERDIMEDALQEVEAQSSGKKIDLQALDQAVRDRLMPLRRVEEDAHSEVGLDRLEPERYDEALALGGGDRESYDRIMDAQEDVARELNAQAHVYRAARPEDAPGRSDVHYQGVNPNDPSAREDYVFHTRTYEPNESTRRVLEIQSDVLQKNLGYTPDEARQYRDKLINFRSQLDQLEDQFPDDALREATGTNYWTLDEFAEKARDPDLVNNYVDLATKTGIADAETAQQQAQQLPLRNLKDALNSGRSNMLRLMERNPATEHKLRARQKNWWKRAAREEIKRAAQDDKKKIQFPTGDTIAEIEGWNVIAPDEDLTGLRQLQEASPSRDVTVLQAAEFVSGNLPPEDYIIQNILPMVKAVDENKTLGDVQDMSMDELNTIADSYVGMLGEGEISSAFQNRNRIPDEFKGIYDRYDKDMRKFLQQQFDAEEVTDDQGNTWMEVPVEPEYADQPVLEFSRRDIAPRISRIG